MKIPTCFLLACTLASSAIAGDATAASRTFSFHKPLYWGQDKNDLVKQIGEIDFNDESQTDILLVYASKNEDRQIILARTIGSFGVSLSPKGSFLFVTNNFAPAQNYGIIFRKHNSTYPWLSPVRMTPATPGERVSWSLVNWDEDNTQMTLQKSIEGRGSHVETIYLKLNAFPLPSTLPGSNVRVLSPKKRHYYQMVPNIGADGHPTNQMSFVVGSVDHSWTVAVNNIPANMTVKWSAKEDSVSLIDNSNPDRETVLRKTSRFPFVALSRIAAPASAR